MHVMDELYAGIAAGLKAVRDCAVFREELPAEYSRPAFLTCVCQMELSGGLNGRRKNTVSFDVRYFPEDAAGIGQREACWRMGCELGRHFEVSGFKIKNRNMRVGDNILHCFFDISFTDYEEENIPQMQVMSQNTELKEE